MHIYVSIAFRHASCVLRVSRSSEAERLLRRPGLGRLKLLRRLRHLLRDSDFLHRDLPVGAALGLRATQAKALSRSKVLLQMVRGRIRCRQRLWRVPAAQRLEPPVHCRDDVGGAARDAELRFLGILDRGVWLHDGRQLSTAACGDRRA